MIECALSGGVSCHGMINVTATAPETAAEPGPKSKSADACRSTLQLYETLLGVPPREDVWLPLSDEICNDHCGSQCDTVQCN